MAKPWDNGMKRLLNENTQDFLDWLCPGARFTGNRSKEFESVTFEADLMQETIMHDERMMFHLEFQTTADPKMDVRRRLIMKKIKIGSSGGLRC